MKSSIFDFLHVIRVKNSEIESNSNVCNSHQILTKYWQYYIAFESSYFFEFNEIQKQLSTRLTRFEPDNDILGQNRLCQTFKNFSRKMGNPS